MFGWGWLLVDIEVQEGSEAKETRAGSKLKSE
jgi:hypothetical protein